MLTPGRDVAHAPASSSSWAIRAMCSGGCGGPTGSARAPRSCSATTRSRPARRRCAISTAASRARCRSPNLAARLQGSAGLTMEPALASRLDQLIRRHDELRDAPLGERAVWRRVRQTVQGIQRAVADHRGHRGVAPGRVRHGGGGRHGGRPGDEGARRGGDAEPARAAARAGDAGQIVAAAQGRGRRRATRSSKSAPAPAGTRRRCSPAELFRMYQRYAALHGWRFEVLDLSETGIGGFKEAAASITGRDVFARLKFESGVHRVQRVPETEAAGASTPRRRPSRCCPRPRRSTSRSTTRTCASTCSAPAGRAGSRSTPPTARCASPTCRPGSS